MTEKEKGASKELVDYFIEQTNERFSILESKMDTLIQFKWQIIGGSIVASLLITFIINIVAFALKGAA